MSVLSEEEGLRLLDIQSRLKYGKEGHGLSLDTLLWLVDTALKLHWEVIDLEDIVKQLRQRVADLEGAD